MPAYDYVSLPGAPNLANIPQVNFDWLGNLGKDFQQGQQYQYQRNQQTAFNNGIPTTDGKPLAPDYSNADYNSILQTIAKTQGAAGVGQILPQMMQRQQGAQDAATALRLYPPNDGSDTAANGGGGGSTGAPGGAQPAPQSAQQPPPPFAGGGTTARPGSPANGVGPQNIAGQYNPNPQITGYEGMSGGLSLRQMVAANGGTDSQAGTVAARLGVDANAPISPKDAPRIARLLMTMGIGQRFGQRAPDAATNQEAGPISTGEVSSHAGETNPSQGRNGLGSAAAAPAPPFAPGMGGGGPSPVNRDSVPQPPGGPLQPRPVPTTSYTPANPQGVPTSPPGVRYPPGITAETQQQLQARARGFNILAIQNARQNKELSDKYAGMAAQAQTQYNDNQKAINDYNSKTNDLNAQAYDKKYSAAIDEGRAGQLGMEDSQSARSILQHPDMWSGEGAELASKTAQWARFVGLPVNTALPDLMGAFKKNSAQAMLNQVRQLRDTAAESGTSGGPGRVFATEMDKMAEASYSAKDNTIPANLYLATKNERFGARMLDISNGAIAYKKEHGALDAGWDQWLNNYFANHHVITPQEERNPTLLMSREFRSPQEAIQARVKPGETVRIRTGPDPMDFRYMTFGSGGKQRPMTSS